MTEDPNALALSKTIAEHEATISSLKADNAALKAEFAQASSYEETLTVAKNAIADLLEISITTTRTLIANADSESVRASLSKFVIDTVLSGKLNNETEDSIKSLLQKLADNDPPPNTPTKEQLEEEVANMKERKLADDTN